MKKSILFSLVCLLMITSCVNMDLPSKNKISDDDLMSTQSGMAIYMARLYSLLPVEDFKYMAQWGIPRRSSWLGCLGIEGTGEALTRDGICTSFTGEEDSYWSEPLKLIREANHLIATLPEYKDNYAEVSFNEYLGEGYFVRAMAFYQMARRFGGIPLPLTEIEYTPDEPEKMEVPRSSEEDTWNQILADFTTAAELLPQTAAKSGYANKYVALAYKAEAMLYAGCVAKYNETVAGRLTGLGEKTGVRVIGFASDRWQEASIKYFTEAYKAAREIMKDGKYSLYKAKWVAGDKEAIYQNMVDMFSDLSSPENIFVREYSYHSLTHGIDAYSSPYSWRAPLSAGTCPTLDFVELFDGLPRYPDGTLKVTDGNTNTEGNYILYDDPMDLFKDVEPRLRAYVILPMDTFRNKEIEVRGGIYTGSLPIKPLHSDYSYQTANVEYQHLEAYTGSPKTLYLSPNALTSQETVEVKGEQMTAAGYEGPFYSNGAATITGFYLRKYLDPNMKLEDIGEGKSDQPFILMRYADVLLAAAEAAVELELAGAPCPVDGDNMLQIATDAINDIRERAGAELLTTTLKGDIESRNIVRKERRKELAFEHKSKWDIRRWRVIHEEGRDGFWGMEKDASTYSSGIQFMFRGLYPFYSMEADKYFFDAHFQWVARKTFRYNVVDYYFGIPSGEVSKSKVIDQQPNR